MLKFGNIPKYFTETLGTLPKFLYLCTVVDGRVTNKAVTNGVLCDRKYVLYIDTANIRLFSHTSKF